jgi:ribosomal-protein-alanine N-acetyltransferase
MIFLVRGDKRVKTPILETERLILRPFCMEDAQAVFQCWESEPDVAKYMFWERHNDINKTINWVKKELSKINTDDQYEFYQYLT